MCVKVRQEGKDNVKEAAGVNIDTKIRPDYSKKLKLLKCRVALMAFEEVTDKNRSVIYDNGDRKV